ncbi:MAG: TetR/AcrR family transcriptional regulator, partial [Halobacteriota archaeon]
MKGFSDEERAQIREDLIVAGRDLFTTMGLERTRVKDLTDEVGIGTSTFYQFFDSKGTLYLTVLNDEVERIAREYEGVLEDAPDLRTEVHHGLDALFEELETNPLFYRAVVENEHQQLIRRLSPEQQRENFPGRADSLMTLAERWTRRSNFRLDDPEAVVDLLRMLSQTVRMREQFQTLSS